MRYFVFRTQPKNLPKNSRTSSGLKKFLVNKTFSLCLLNPDLELLPDLLTNPIQASFNSPLVWGRRVEVAINRQIVAKRA